MKMFLVEKLVKGDFQPIGCADSFGNAMLLLKGHSGRIFSQNNREFLIVSEYAD